MGDFLQAIVDGLGEFFTEMTAFAWVWLYWAFTYMSDRLEVLWQWLRDDVIGYLWYELFQALPELIPDGVQERFEDVDWLWWFDKVQEVTWILPIYPMLQIIIATYLVCATIRAVRWCLSVIPLVNVG
jgi:hypothetical protein